MQNAWAFGETLQLRDRGCTWCFFAPKGTLCCFDLEATKFHLESDEVLCSPEILSGGFTQSLLILVDIECIDYSWIFDCRQYLGFWKTVPVSRGSYSMPKLREYVHNKSETLFRIVSHFQTNIEYSRRVHTLISVEIILWELTPRSEHEFFLSVETSRFYSMSKVENFLNYKAKIIIEIAWHF